MNVRGRKNSYPQYRQRLQRQRVAPLRQRLESPNKIRRVNNPDEAPADFEILVPYNDADRNSMSHEEYVDNEEVNYYVSDEVEGDAMLQDQNDLSMSHDSANSPTEDLEILKLRLRRAFISSSMSYRQMNAVLAALRGFPPLTVLPKDGRTLLAWQQRRRDQQDREEKPRGEDLAQLLLTSGAPEWALDLVEHFDDRLRTIENQVDYHKNLLQVRQQQNLHQYPPQLPRSLPFQTRAEFEAFESIEEKNFQNLVDHLVDLGIHGTERCANKFFHVCFAPEEEVSQYLTWNGVAQQDKLSLRDSRFAKACYEAIRLSNPMNPPSQAEYRVAMEKALKALDNRRRRRVHARPAVEDYAPPHPCQKDDIDL